MVDQLFFSAILDNYSLLFLLDIGPPMQPLLFYCLIITLCFVCFSPAILLLAVCTRKDVDYRPRPQFGIILLKFPPGAKLTNQSVKGGTATKPSGILTGSNIPELGGSSWKCGPKTLQSSSSSNNNKNNKAPLQQCSSQSSSPHMVLEINQVLDGRQITATATRRNTSKSGSRQIVKPQPKSASNSLQRLRSRSSGKASMSKTCHYNVSHSNGLPPPTDLTTTQESSSETSQAERWKMVNWTVNAKPQLTPLEKPPIKAGGTPTSVQQQQQQQQYAAVSPVVSKPEGSTDFQKPNYWIKSPNPPSSVPPHPAATNSIGSTKDKTPQEPFLVCSLPNSRLNFNGPFDETKTHRFLLTNAGVGGPGVDSCRQLQPMCWAIKPRTNDRLSAVPNHGILTAGQSIVVQVKCGPFKFDSNSSDGLPRDARIDRLSIAWAVVPMHRQQDCEQFNLEWIAHGNIGNRKNIVITYTV